MKSSKNLLRMMMSVVLGTNYAFSAHAIDYPQLTGGNIILNEGDTVSSINPGTIGQNVGINASAPTDSLTINGAVTITVKGNQSLSGIYLNNANKNDLGNGTIINAIVEETAATGLELGENALDVKGTHLLFNMVANRGYAYGISTSKNSKLDLGENSVINIGGDGFGIGINALGGDIHANGLHINVNNSHGYGIYLDSTKMDLGLDSVIKIDSADGGIQVSKSSSLVADRLTVVSSQAKGVNVQSGSSADLGSNTHIMTAGDNGEALSAFGQKSTIIADHLSVTTTGVAADGISATTGAVVNIGAGSLVNTVQGNGISSVQANLNFLGSEIERNAINIHAKMAVQSSGIGGVVNVANTDITGDNTASSDKASVGLFSNMNGVINAENVNITLNGLARSVFSQNGGKVNLTGETTINNDSAHLDSFAFAVSGTGSAINLSGKAVIQGNLYAEKKGMISANMDDGSYLKGSALLGDATSKIDLTMENSLWDMTDNSQISSLNLNQTDINFTQLNRANPPEYNTLATDSLMGQGIFHMRTNIVGQRGDLLVVNGTASGTHRLVIANNGAASTTGKERLTVVKTGINNADFSLANKVELGAYEYGLRTVAGEPNELELYASGNHGDGGFSSTAKAATGFLNIGYFTNYIENQTLFQRLGELRYGNMSGVQHNGLWVRSFTGKLNAFSGGVMEGYDMRYTGTQFGLDRPITVSQGYLIIGGMIGLTKTNPNYQSGSGNSKNLSTALYATYFLDKGLYIDAMFKYNNMRNHFNVYDTAGARVAGTGRTEGLSLSAELGKRFWLSDNRQGFYLEPQIQFTYGYQHGDTVHADNGLTVKLSDYNTALGRISGIMGYQIAGKNPVNIYVKTGMISELSGSVDYRFNDSTPNHYWFRSHWFNHGLGANIILNQKHNFYTEADYSTGNRFNNFMLNIGYRYMF